MRSAARSAGLGFAAAGVLLLASGCGPRDESPPPGPPIPPLGEPAEPTPEERAVKARFDRALSEIRAGRDWAGLWHLTVVRRDDPRHRGAMSGLGVYAYRQGRYEDVAGHLEPLAEIRTLLPDELLALADAASRLHRFAAAESLYTIYVTRRPDDPKVRIARGLARKHLGRLSDAAADFRRAAPLDTEAGTASLELAAVLLDLHRPGAARSALTAAEETDADPARLHRLRGRCLAQLVDRRDLDGDYRSGAVGTWRKASKAFRKALAFEPNDLEALHLLMQVRRKLGDPEGALDAARRHREALAALDPAPQIRAVQALVQGAIAAEEHDDERALTAYERGLEADPENVNLHGVLVPLYRTLGRTEAARASFARLREAAGEAGPGSLFLATGKELRRRGLGEAAAGQFEIAVQEMPDDEEAAYFLALARSEAGDWEGAFEAAAPLEAPGS